MEWLVNIVPTPSGVYNICHSHSGLRSVESCSQVVYHQRFMVPTDATANCAQQGLTPLTYVLTDNHLHTHQELHSAGAEAADAGHG